MEWAKWLGEQLIKYIFDSFSQKKRKETAPPLEEHENAIIDVIKNSEISNSILAKSPIENFNTKSILIVMPGEEAIFVDNGQIKSILKEGRHILNTSNYPFLRDMIKTILKSQYIFSSRIYFIRTADSFPIDWGTNITVRDPIQLIATRILCRGSYKVRILDSEKFLKYCIGNGINKLKREDMSKLLADEILQVIKTSLSIFVQEMDQELLELVNQQNNIAEYIGERIKSRYSMYGIEIVHFTITGINFLYDKNRSQIEQTYTQKRIEQIKKFH